MGTGSYGIDMPTVDAIADDVIRACPSGAAVVVGGGNVFRGLAGAAGGLDRVKGDFLGMLATIMNGVVLEQAFRKRGRAAKVYCGLPVPTMCETFQRDKAKADLDAGYIVVLAGGTGNPFFTTDTTAALRAAELGCDAILKATMVDGIYSDDPRKNPNAQRFDRISFSDVLARDLKVMDAAAIALARDNKIPIVVFSLFGRGAIEKVLKGEISCTVVHEV